MNQPIPDLPQPSDAAATESTASEKKAAKTALKKTPKPSGKAVVKASSKASAKSAAKATTTKAVAAPVIANTSGLSPEATEVASATHVKTAKPKKAKLVRDSFTMPESEYNLIAEVKKRCLARGESVKKSEVLRAAIIAFAALPDASIGTALHALAHIKTGRPPKH